MDRHKLWRRVVDDYEQLTTRAPAGYEPIVEVFLAGREAPVELGFVETRRDDYDPWVRFQARNRARDAESTTDPLHSQDLWIHVHESNILRVEICYRRAGNENQSIGFSHTVYDDADETSAADA